MQRNGLARTAGKGGTWEPVRARNLFWIMGGDNDPKGDREAWSLSKDCETAPAHQLATTCVAAPFEHRPVPVRAQAWLQFHLRYWPEKLNDWVAGKPQPHVMKRRCANTEIRWCRCPGRIVVRGLWRQDNDMDAADGTMAGYWTMLSAARPRVRVVGHLYFPRLAEILRYPGASTGHFIRLFEASVVDVATGCRAWAVVAGYGEWARNNFVTVAVSDDVPPVAYLPGTVTATSAFSTATRSSCPSRSGPGHRDRRRQPAGRPAAPISARRTRCW
jgi:hypothetical protein